MHRTRRFISLIVVCCVLCGARVPAQNRPTENLESFVETAMREWEVPGLAVAVVKDDALVWARGFGVREVGKAGAVDERTLFATGSATKSFTAAAVALLVDEGKVKWDDPVTKHLPDFQLFDPHLTREVTVRDLLAHRTGLPRANASLLIPYTSAEVVRRMRHLKPVAGLRAQFTYQNQMYLVAGLLIEKVSGMSWEAFVRERLFKSLGMAASNTSVKALAGIENVSAPHAKIQGAVRAIPYRSIDNYAPAGAVNSSALDLARWVRLQLNRGAFEGKQLVSPSAAREMHAPQTIIPIGALSERLFPSTHFFAYGMGWFLRDYRGRKVIEHGGNVDGMSAQLGMLPEERLGVVILSNRETSPLPQILMYRIFDAYLGVASEPDLNAEFRKLTRDAEAQRAAQQKQAEEGRASSTTAPPLAPEKYAGTYSNDLYGDAQVTYENGKLRLRFSEGVGGELEHWNGHTFRVSWSNPLYTEAVGKTLVSFEVGADGVVAELKAQNLADFRRAPPKTAAGSAVRKRTSAEGG